MDREVRMIGRLALFLWIAGWMVAAFLWAPLVPVLGETTRVLYFHIPAAWVTVLALAWSMGHSVLYLRRRRIEHDHHAAAAAEIGILFCVAATISATIKRCLALFRAESSKICANSRRIF